MCISEDYTYAKTTIFFSLKTGKKMGIQAGLYIKKTQLQRNVLPRNALKVEFSLMYLPSGYLRIS